MARRRFAWIAAMLGACSLSVSLPEGKLRKVARDTLQVGHPLAEFRDARFLGGSSGACSGSRHLDVAIDYASPAGGTYTMQVQYVVRSVDPCRIEPVVIEDDGPIPPVLLKSSAIAQAVGDTICEQFR